MMMVLWHMLWRLLLLRRHNHERWRRRRHFRLITVRTALQWIAVAIACHAAAAYVHGAGARALLVFVFLARFFHLVAMILKPDFHLSSRQAKRFRHVFAFWRAQVLLLFEAVFQLKRLLFSEQNTTLTFLASAATAAATVVVAVCCNATRRRWAELMLCRLLRRWRRGWRRWWWRWQRGGVMMQEHTSRVWIVLRRIKLMTNCRIVVELIDAARAICGRLFAIDWVWFFFLVDASKHLLTSTSSSSSPDVIVSSSLASSLA